MRLFVAIDCEEVKDELLMAQKEFASLRARLTKNFHLTLCFIGEVNHTEVEKIKEKLIQVSAAPFRLQLSKLGTFTSYSQRVIWCGLVQSKPLFQLHHQIYHIINEGDEQHKYLPHITIARLRKHQKMKRDEKQVLDNGLKKEGLDCSFSVNKFKLYESTNTPKGPIYRVIKEYNL